MCRQPRFCKRTFVISLSIKIYFIFITTCLNFDVINSSSLPISVVVVRQSCSVNQPVESSSFDRS